MHKCQKRPIMCQKRPIKCQKRPISHLTMVGVGMHKCQKRPIIEVKETYRSLSLLSLCLSLYHAHTQTHTNTHTANLKGVIERTHSIVSEHIL